MKMEQRNLVEMFRGVVRDHGDGPAYHYEADGGWREITWKQQGDICDRISKGLMALGVEKGDRVAVLARTRVEWVQCDSAIVNAGACTVGIYPSNLADACAFIMVHSDSAVVFVENADQLEKILSVRNELPLLRQIVLIEGQVENEEGVCDWATFLDSGGSISDAALEARGSALERDDVASIVYTSGTTGAPKGAMITHGNLLFSIESVSAYLRFHEGYSTLMFLPLAHIFARLMSYCCLAGGLPVHYTYDIANIAQKLQQVRPHFIISVPRIYEKFYDKIVTGAEAAGGAKAKIFNWAISVGTRVSLLQQEGRSPGLLLRMRHALADKLVLHKIRNAFGGRIVWAVSGAAPLNEAIARFFHACGVFILEGIGMTENTSFSNVNQLTANKFGTVGKAGPGIDIRIAEDGEVLIHAPNVMRGYFKNPESTAETINAEGWLHTGDIGEIDSDGFLKITDRKKDLIITAGGKNVAPQRIERILRESKFISQAVAYGDRKKFLTALITLDRANISDWAAAQGLGSKSVEELSRETAVQELIAKEIETQNEQLASFETIKRFHILPHDLSIESGELTPTLKVKRKVVVENHREQLEALYAQP